MGEHALHAPGLAAQAGAMLGAPPGDQRLHSESPDQAAVWENVVAAS